MERAEARRLQPHFIASFFREAFAHLDGSLRERESKRYEITRVPAAIRRRDRIIGVGEPVLERYERITFKKDLISITEKAAWCFCLSWHPLLNATLDLILEHYSDLLKQVLFWLIRMHKMTKSVSYFYLEHAIQDGRILRDGKRWVVSRQMQFVEIDQDKTVNNPGICPLP